MTVFALDHVSATRCRRSEFAAPAKRPGRIGVELRNDPGGALLDGGAAQASEADPSEMTFFASAEISAPGGLDDRSFDAAVELIECRTEAVAPLPPFGSADISIRQLARRIPHSTRLWATCDDI